MRIVEYERAPRRFLLRWLGWFGVGITALLVLVSLRNLGVSDPPQGLLASLYRLLMFFGQGAFLAFVPLFFVLLAIIVWPRRGPMTGLATALGAFVVFATLVDTIIFRQYRFHLNAEIWNLLFGGAADEILVFSATMYLQATLVLAVVVGLVLLMGRLAHRLAASGARRRSWGPLVALVLVGCFASQAVLHAWADVAGFIPVTRQSRLMLFYIPITAEGTFEKLGVEVERADRALLASHGGTNLKYPRRQLECSGTDEPLPNILFIVIDGWRQDAFNERVTPNIARHAPAMLRFRDHLAGGSATRTGIFSMFYGIPGTYWHVMLSEQRGPVLIPELRKLDYQMQIFGSAKLFNPEFHRTAFVEVPELRQHSDGESPSARDRDANADFLEWLDAREPGRPFMSMVFYDAAHGYDLPDDAPRPFEPSLEKVNYLALGPNYDPEPFHNLFRNCIYFNDSLAGELLDGLEERGLLEETIVVLTGDHGEEFNDLGLNYWGHDSNFARWQIAVPFLVLWPGREAREFDHRTSHYDIVPTLLQELAGCTNDPDDYTVGRNLFEPGGRESLLLANYTDYAIVQEDRIIAVYPYGVEILDLDYRPLPDAEMDAAVRLEALDQRSRFLK
jgi:membrane-anchored protein YejM (alkaline phosphatase superfamily)